MGVIRKNIIVKATNLVKEYSTGHDQILPVLKGLDLEVKGGEVVIIVGPSGSGKSTLLHLLGGLDRPTKGSVSVSGRDIFSLSDEELAKFRNRSLGFIFQFHHLLPEFNALENVLLPAYLKGDSRRAAMERGEALLAEVGLADRMNHRPNELSGGEQQRVAVARALMNEPPLVLADEPSGNLDELNGLKLHQLLLDLARRKGITFVIATHNQDLAARGDRILRLSQGTLTPLES